MLEIAKLLQAALLTDNQISLLVEGGAYEDDVFRQLHEKNSARMHSLYLHPQLKEAQMAGPWLLVIDGPETLAAELKTFPLAAGVIFHSASASVLASQLSWGCTPLNPENKTVVSRFYIREVLEALAQPGEAEWHSFLFQDIQQWWTPDKHGWSPIAIAPSTAQRPLDHTVRLDEKTWAQIYDHPEVTSILTQWQKFPSAQTFPPCSQRSMATRALDKARTAGMNTPADRKLYALVYLDGGRPLLESAAVQSGLADVTQGKRSLRDLLLTNEQG